MVELGRPSSTSDAAFSQYPLPSRLHTTPELTLQKLGFVSPSYELGHRNAAHGIIGSFGYTSSQSKTLLPAAPNRRARITEGQRLAAGSSHKPSSSVSGGRILFSALASTSLQQQRQLSAQEKQFLQDHDQRSHAAWEEWVSSKQAAEDAAQRHTRPKSKQEVLKEFMIKEIQIKNLSSKKVLEWEMKKSLREEVEALQHIHADRSHRAKLIQNRLRDLSYQGTYAEREEKFTLRTSSSASQTKQGLGSRRDTASTSKAGRL
ncbi:hypothetical protein CEUSTIGMA_g7489.t1 [Chlamydomonas eustigma]|uniref:Uncharacterized protein n=1 Tax=Chlamydomonas eustigma TaxID=1157962 RepID=A0A250XBA6_9CHLO|nr:hypothetical protein CEUSTIGMA_g7489.t1 [Chlamydomonas eustigma]|eukprot:GAX80050.1 hypothetical protein CEUSTIGMA_g7489.t1 [Chlamydomonas eustigma]